jgi:putative transposase
MCKTLKVSASGFYGWLDRPMSQRQKANVALSAQIRQAFVASDETYGMPRIRAELMDAGMVASRKRIARLMRQEHMRGVSRRRSYCVTTERDVRQRPAPDLVQRQFVATDLNQLWVADMTYIPTWAGFLYLSVVIDVYSRKVVGWAFGERMTADLVVLALNMALMTRKPQSVIHHSDQGSQGGFNWSSQHLQPGGVYGATRRMDEAIYEERRDALSGGSFASARGRAPVLGTDCNRHH